MAQVNSYPDLAQPGKDLCEQQSSSSFDDLMKNITYTIRKYDKYPLHECIIRTVILIGRTRTGKSTVARVIENPNHVPEQSQLHSETKDIEFHPLAAALSTDSKVFSFNFIDTPGLYDQVEQKGVRIDNESIKKAISKCITKDMTNIHAFAFVFSLYGGINNEDIQSMIFFKKNFPMLKDHVVLLITHMEEMKSEDGEKKVEEFFRSQAVVEHNLKEFFGQRIFYMGCLRPQLRSHPNEASAGAQIDKIIKMRARFLEYIIQCEKPFNIHYHQKQSPSNDPDLPEAQPHNRIRDQSSKDYCPIF